ncbi:uncharacterized protein LOC143287013 [Babylonia areolata]|uniref:uncharacterized protein LOC143287013 n=1 Tax=Babylonia areolata TaxID=304850 RepID=UPI003FD20862
MGPFSRIAFVSTLQLIALHSVTSSVLLVDDEHVECTSQADLLGKCELGSRFSRGYRCYVTPGVKCQGVLHVGEGSTCVRTGTNDFFRCSRGHWLGTLEENEEEYETPEHKIVKRGWRSRRIRFRGRRIRFRGRRTWCNIWHRRRTCNPSPEPEEPPNKPPYFSFCPTVPLHTADSGQLTTTVTWPDPIAVDPENETPSVSRVSGGPSSGGLFPEGTTSVMYKARDSHGLADYCLINVQVSVITCSSGFTTLQNGQMTCSGARHNIYGSECTHSCSAGYELVGSSSVRCQSDGTWSSSFPTCQPVQCGAPAGGVAGGSLSCPLGLSYSSICLVNCQPGYVHTGTAFIQCQANQNWTLADPCQDQEAPRFPSGCPANQQLFSGPLGSPVSVTWPDPQVTDNSNQSVTLTSSVAKGTAVGPGFHVIWVTGTDPAGNWARCNFVVMVQERTCPTFVAPAHSQVSCTSGLVEGSECSLACDPGYQLQGNASVRCVSPGVWDSTLPTCHAISCPAPVAPSHGSFQCGWGMEFRSLCTLTCDPGYGLQGSPSVQCLANGTWSAAGTCEDTELPQFVNNPCHSNLNVFSPRLGQPAIVTFSNPDVTDNSGSPLNLTSDVTSGSSFPVGVTPVTFTVTDVAGNSVTCVFTVTVTSLVCDPPNLEAANRTRTLMTYTCPDGYVYGATCTLGCSHGFPLSGSSNITCEVNNQTYPPTTEWVWPEPHLGPPECKEDNCPTLNAGVNGALACFLGNYGKDCLMSCAENWDIPAYTDGRFVCANSNGYWLPPTVPGCVVRMLPGRVRLQTDVFYFSGSCSTSLDSLKQNFIARISNSTWKDACVGVASCVWQNVQVSCGPTQGFGRRKRAADLWTGLFHRFTRTVHSLLRRKRQTHYVLIAFEIALDYMEENVTRQQAYQNYMAIFSNIYALLQNDANAGLLDLGNLTTDGYSVGYPRVALDCPPGTLFKSKASTTSFSCAGCYKGHYLPPNATACLECPRGQYSDIDNATACLPCPPGWSTPSTGAENSSECRELCPPGSVSPSGFLPCQACPPGHFQSQNGSSQCAKCPAGTWTASSNATGLLDCLESEVRLSANQSVSAEVGHGQWSSSSSSSSSLSAQLWLNMGVNSSCNVSLSLGDSPSTVVAVCVTVFTNGTTAAASGSSCQADVEVVPDTWTNLLFNLDPQNAAGDVQVFHHGSALQSLSLGIAADQPVHLDTTTPHTMTGDTQVRVSGFRAEGHSLTQAEITAALVNCSTGEHSGNLMTWIPSPDTVFSPSTCDAVNECLSGPCHPQHGRCQNLQGGFQCLCEDGWSGSTCQVPPGVCYLHPCQNGASCVPASTSPSPSPSAPSPSAAAAANFYCVCDAEYSGTLCELPKVHGGYSSWEAWSACTATCGGTRHRQRLCSNPAPQNGGRNCTGVDEETELCGSALCPVDGGFSPWGSYGPCSATCGPGERTRHRQCDNPAPQNNGSDCVGQAVEKEACNTRDCPVDGGWRSWEAWSVCPVTCGGANQTRERSCDNPAPSNGGQPCVGVANETRLCNPQPCPVCSVLVRPKGGMLTCEEQSGPPYLKACNLTCFPGYLSLTPAPTYTCGEETGYLWNHQRDHNQTASLPQLPACNRPNTFNSIVISQQILMDTPCNSGADAAVRQRVQSNLAASVPCMVRGQCTLTISSHCQSESDSSSSSSKRRRRSVDDPLVLAVELLMDFGDSHVLDINDTAAVTAYEQQMTEAHNSYLVVTTNATTLFSVTVDGNVITPNNVTYNVYASCPVGYAATDNACVECPAGSYEEDGECVLCSLGQYQDRTASTSCKDCPEGLTWDVLGATDITQCLFPYSAPTDADDADDDMKDNSDDIAVIVGSVCGPVLVLLAAVIAAVIVYQKFIKRPPDGERLFTRRQSRPNSAKVWPETDQSPARAVTPSALQLKVLPVEDLTTAWPPCGRGGNRHTLPPLQTAMLGVGGGGPSSQQLPGSLLLPAVVDAEVKGLCKPLPPIATKDSLI